MPENFFKREPIKRAGCAVAGAFLIYTGGNAVTGAIESYQEASALHDGRQEPKTVVFEGQTVQLPQSSPESRNFAGDVLVVEGLVAGGVGLIFAFSAITGRPRKPQLS